MKALTNEELAMIASDLQSMVGAQLQEARQTEREFGLGFYHDQKMVWLWFDMDPRRPLVLRFENGPPSRQKMTKPLLLFTRAHLIGRRLKEVTMNVVAGRVLEFEFHDAEGQEKRVEVRLFPHGQNLSVVSGEKRISLNKPKDMPTKPIVRAETSASNPISTPISAVNSAPSMRSWNELREQWLAERRPEGMQKTGMQAGMQKTRQMSKQDVGLRSESTAGPPAASLAESPKASTAGVTEAMTEAERLRRTWERACAKKEQAVAKMRVNLDAKADPGWRMAGEWLKENVAAFIPNAAIPDAIRTRLDLSRTLAWNIENCFHHAKENERKLEGTRERLKILERELVQLRIAGPEGYSDKARAKATGGGSRAGRSGGAVGLLERAGARGRTFIMGKGLEAYIGKSAADNMALLRRAQPHDYWLHVRDYPGAHAIVRRPKGRLVTDAELNEIGRWVVVQSLRKSEAELQGGRFDMILAECRYVRPIKGDKLGRVNYQNDRLFVVRFESVGR